MAEAMGEESEPEPEPLPLHWRKLKVGKDEESEGP